MGLILLIAAIAVIRLCSSPSLPSGADPGGLLAHSLAFDESSRELTYAPLLPWVVNRMGRSVSTIEGLSNVLKTLGLALLIFQAASLGCLAWSIGGQRGGAIACTLALASPSAWTQLSWGGYAQFLGVGFGALALAGLVKTSEARARRQRAAWATGAGVAFGLVPLSHSYSVPFFAAACLVAIGASTAGRIRSALAFTFAAIATSSPGWSALYGTIVLGGSLRARGGDLMDTLIPISDGLQNTTFHPVTTLLALAPFVVACLFKASRGRLAEPRTLLPWVAGALVIAALTPPLQMDRAFLIAGHGLTLAIAGGLSSLPKPRLVTGLVGLWALTSSAATLAETEAMSQRGGRLSLEEGRLLKRIGSGGETVAIATESPSVEGYWFRGLTGGRALIGDSYRWYASSREREESALVQNFLLGDYALLGRPLSIVASSPSASEATLVFDDGVEFCPLFHLSVTAGSARISGSAEGFAVEAIGDVRLALIGFHGSRLLDLRPSAEGAELTWEFRYAPYRPRGLRRTVVLKGGSVERSENGAVLAFRNRVTLSHGSAPAETARSVWTLDEVTKAGASRVVASPPFLGRFESDARFTAVDSAGRLRAFAFQNPARGPAPGSLELTPPAMPGGGLGRTPGL